MSPIVAFYRLEAPDRLGRWLRDIWLWDHDHLEDVHDYIQFLFPNWQPGVFRAPLLDDETITAFREDETLRHNLARSYDVMLDFYGLKFLPQTSVVEPAANFGARAANWLNPYNHNHLRITRILICLNALSLPEQARAFFHCLEQLRTQHPDAISAETYAFWQDAAGEEK